VEILEELHALQCDLNELGNTVAAGMLKRAEPYLIAAHKEGLRDHDRPPSRPPPPPPPLRHSLPPPRRR
jgi:hypothetical protein